jgi:hypothetical protein
VYDYSQCRVRYAATYTNSAIPRFDTDASGAKHGPRYEICKATHAMLPKYPAFPICKLRDMGRRLHGTEGDRRQWDTGVGTTGGGVLAEVGVGTNRNHGLVFAVSSWEQEAKCFVRCIVKCRVLD